MDLAAKAVTVSSIEDPVTPGSYQMSAEAFLGSSLNHLLDLNGKILIGRVRCMDSLVGWDRTVQMSMPVDSDKVLCYIEI